MSEASRSGDGESQSKPNLRRHGLEPFFAAAESTPDAGVDIDVLSNRGFLNVRLDARNKRAVNTAEQALGQDLPLVSNTYTNGRQRVYWLGPDEWLVETGADGAAALGGELTGALAGSNAAINDVSAGHVALRVAGADARTVLAKGCALDLHSREFGPGQCARTGLARATVLLVVADAAPAYTIIAGRSFADYLCRWLAHASRPHGARFSML